MFSVLLEKRLSFRAIGDFSFSIFANLFCCFLALLVCYSARGLASGLARGLALAAAAVLLALVEIASFQGDDSFHKRNSFVAY